MRRGRFWCPECFFRVGRALLAWVVIWAVAASWVRARRGRRTESGLGR